MKGITIVSMLAAVILSAASCSKDDEMYPGMNNGNYETSAIFNVSVSQNSISTKGENLINNKELGLDDNIAFGLVGVGIPNLDVFETNGVRSAEIFNTNNSNLSANAYYPFVSDVDCQEDGTSIITFSEVDFQKGPMVSNEVEINFNQSANVLNLQFHHVAEQIGFKIEDVTVDEQLTDLISIRKVLLYGAATQGVYVNSENPYWIPQYSRKPYVVFNGEYKLDQSTAMKSDCFYVVPEDMDDSKYVEVVFDVNDFDFDGTHYNASENSLRISLADVQLDENIYTLELDLAEVFKTIEFGASVGEWENETIIEN